MKSSPLSKPVKFQVWDQVRKQVSIPMKDQVIICMSNQMLERVWKARDQVWEQVSSQVSEDLEP